MNELTKDNIIALLKDEDNQQNVENFAAYCVRTKLEKDKHGKSKNYWMQNKTATEMAQLYKRVANEGLVFDGKHITLQSRGISYDYVAYKNKMMLAYPESLIDLQLVYEGDTISFGKNNGKVTYLHEIKDPFNQKDEKVIGGYCVIKNKRGEFLTTLSREELEKHRKIAKTDYIWIKWFKEMCLKTIMKKGTKAHFDDVFEGMNEEDNKEIDLDLPVDLDLQTKQEIEAISTMEELKEYAQANAGKGATVAKMIVNKKQELQGNEAA